MLNVHLRIHDTATGQALPVRLRITGTDGENFPPLGRLAEFSTLRGEDVGGQFQIDRGRWYAINGGCEVALPATVPLRVQAFHGPCFAPIDELITLKPGQMAVRLGMRRLLHWAEDWYGGDGRVHFLSPHAALLEAAAEDLDVVNLLAHPHRFFSQDGNSYAGLGPLLAFSGQSAALQEGTRLVAVNTLNRHAMLGELALLHAHRPIYPLSFGPPDQSDDWSLADWCHQCHRKKGYVVWVDPWKQNGTLLGGEALVVAILGFVDALEYDGQTRKTPFLPLWYRLLNCGLRLPLIGASGKDSNRSVLGYPRTYARLKNPQARNYSSWIHALQENASFVTNGPMIELNWDAATQTAHLRAESVFPFDRVDFLQQGRPTAVAQAQLVGDVWRAEQSLQLAGDHSFWLAARILTDQDSPLAPGQPLFAHTNPIWVERPAGPPPLGSEDSRFLREAVEQTRTWYLEQAQFTREDRKSQHLERCDEALLLLSQRAL